MMIEPAMPESHEARLKTALKLNECDDLPKDVVDIYWQVARTARRLGAPCDTSELLLVCLLANKPSRPDPVSFLDNTELEYGTRVLAKFRNQWRFGKLIRVDKQTKKVIVSLDDDPGADERTFSPTSVTLPSHEELKGIGESP
jgi:hypothetical protein